MQTPIDGAAIKAWRKAKNVTREELAKLCNVSPSTIHNWESERNRPHGAAAEHLVRLMAGEKAVQPLTPVEDRLMNEAVQRGGFASREEFLADAVLRFLKEGGRG